MKGKPKDSKLGCLQSSRDRDDRIPVPTRSEGDSCYCCLMESQEGSKMPGFPFSDMMWKPNKCVCQASSPM